MRFRLPYKRTARRHARRPTDVKALLRGIVWPWGESYEVGVWVQALYLLPETMALAAFLLSLLWACVYIFNGDAIELDAGLAGYAWAHFCNTGVYPAYPVRIVLGHCWAWRVLLPIAALVFVSPLCMKIYMPGVYDARLAGERAPRMHTS